MKKITLLLFASAIFTVGSAQQFPLQSQYQYNYSSINPAAVGENDFYSLRASFRSQWRGFSDQPIATQFVTLTKGIGNNGLGITLINDKTGGAFNKSGVAISYSHKIIVSSTDFYFGGQKIIIPESELFFGVSAGGSQINFDLNAEDPAVLVNNDLIPEVVVGGYYKIKDFKLGISVPGLLKTNMEITAAQDNILESHFYSMLSYEKQISSQWHINPSILVKTTANHNQIDANVNLKFKNKLWFGTSYRQDFGPTVYLGIDFGRLFSIYSYDISTNEVSSYSSGSHEFTIGYDFKPLDEIEEQRVVEEDLYDNDKDKDGVEDHVDLCPSVFGDAIADGCPDVDKDGVPDKYDLCPNLAGSKENLGCPILSDKEEEILSMALGNLKFDYDSDVIKYSSYTTLVKLMVLLQSNTDMNLFIDGHASSEGTDRYNMDLSSRRVRSVRDFFVEKGVEKNRIHMDWQGEQAPLNTNTTEKERAENRRVEFDIRFHLSEDATVAQLKAEYQSVLSKINKSLTLVNSTAVTTEQADEVENIDFKTDSVSNDYDAINDTTINKIITEEYEDTVSPSDSIKVVDWDDTVQSKEVAEGTDYILVVQVFSSLENVERYIENSDKQLNYKQIQDKFYVYVFSSSDRESVERYRSEYGQGSWIKNP